MHEPSETTGFIAMIVSERRPPAGSGAPVPAIAVTVWRGKTYEVTTAKGATMALARRLVSIGCPDQPWRTYRTGRLATFGPSLHRLAMWTIREDEVRGPEFIRYQPFPLSQSAPQAAPTPSPAG